jgi:hypothetical protein
MLEILAASRNGSLSMLVKTSLVTNKLVDVPFTKEEGSVFGSLWVGGGKRNDVREILRTVGKPMLIYCTA